jgi:hypothetical protein
MASRLETTYAETTYAEIKNEEDGVNFSFFYYFCKEIEE